MLAPRGGAQLRLRGNEPVYKYLLSKSSATADAAASRCHLTQKSASADAASCCYLTQKSASADAALCCYLLKSQLRLMQLRLEAAAPLALLLLCELRASSNGALPAAAAAAAEGRHHRLFFVASRNGDRGML